MKRLIILVGIALISCNSQKAAQKKLTKLQKDHPELFYADTSYIITNDTVTIPIPVIHIDTLVNDADTVFIRQKQVELKIIKENQYVRVQGKCTPDTIKYAHTDTLTLVKEEIVTKTVKIKHTPFIAKVGIFFFLFTVGGILFKMLKNSQLFGI